MDNPETRKRWLDNPRNVDRIVWAIYGICGALLAVDWFVPKHGPFPVEHWFGFYGFYGFFACVALVLAAKELRRVLMRSEDYYDN